MASLDNALILVSWRKKSRRQCNTKTRSASIDYLSVIVRFFSLFYFYLDPNVSLKQQKKSTFLSIRESLRREKFNFGRFTKVYARKSKNFANFSSRESFCSRKYLITFFLGSCSKSWRLKYTINLNWQTFFINLLLQFKIDEAHLFTRWV